MYVPKVAVEERFYIIIGRGLVIVKTRRTRKCIYLRQEVKNGKKVTFFVLPCRLIFEQTCLKRKKTFKQIILKFINATFDRRPLLILHCKQRNTKSLKESFVYRMIDQSSKDK